MPLYLDGSESTSITEPTGSSSGSAAAIPACTATPAVVTIPLQYAVALNARRAPGIGTPTVSCIVACRAAYFESSAVTSYSEAKLHAATAVRMTFRHTDLAMIMSVCAGSCHESGGGLSRTQARADTRHTQESARQESSQRRTGSAAVSEL